MHASNSTTGAGASARISIQFCSGKAVHPFRDLMSTEYAPARSARFTARRHGFSTASATIARIPLDTCEACTRSGRSSSLRMCATSSTGNPSIDAVSCNALHHPGSSEYMTDCHAASSRLSCLPVPIPVLVLPPVSFPVPVPVPSTSTAGQTPSPVRPIPVSPVTASASLLER